MPPHAPTPSHSPSHSHPHPPNHDPAATTPITPKPARVTRLAPSPTGALHLGNVRTFLFNWALARQRGWRIILRIEDLDTPRVKPGALHATVETLAWLGLDWDEGPIIQSHDMTRYHAAMAHLARAGMVYPSALSRAAGATATTNATTNDDAASAPQEGAHEAFFGPENRPAQMPRDFLPTTPNPTTPTTPTTDAPAWRFATPDVEVAFDDALAGPQRLRPARSVGDFILWTKRGQPSYQLAVVVDDAHSAITDVVRGDDLLDSAARQTLLYHALNLAPTPHYWHLPLVRGHDGRRLAKRHGDTRVDAYRALGVSPERIIGLAASWCGITNHPNTHPNPHPAPQPISARECIPRLDPRTISRSPITFTREDHQWLLTTPTAAS